MNNKLTEQIIKHVLSGFGVYSLHSTSKSLFSKEFKLDQTIDFEENDQLIKNAVYACQATVENKNIKVLIANLTVDPEIPEYAGIVALEDSPAYGFSMVMNDIQNVETYPCIAAYSNDIWVRCTIFLQATFLAAMENIKELGLSWENCTTTNNSKEFELLQSYITYYNKEMFDDSQPTE